MKYKQQLTALIILLLTLVLLYPASGCQPKETAGGSLNLWDSGPTTLDPAIPGGLSSHIYITQIFSGLVRLDEDLKPAPDIAERWQKSPDGKTYTFFLRDGVKFHDGKEVTAYDFLYSWERACDPRTGSQIAATYLGDIVGANEMLAGRATEISGVHVIDDHTIEVTIDAPKAYFLAKLAYATGFVVDEANVESSPEWWRKPNGTGPFKLKQWIPEELIVMEPNTLYYGKQAQVDEVSFHLLAGIPMSLYETDEIDIAPIYQQNIDRARDEKGPFYNELNIFPELSFYYIGFNTRNEPFDDVNVRRAFCYAVNKERIVKIILKGMANTADGILPPGMPGYSENVEGLNFDVDKAKSLIASSKYGSVENLPPITITDAGEGGNIPEYLGAVIQDWQQNLGVEVTVRQLEWEAFSSPRYLKQEVDDMFTFGWIADYPDPQDFLDILFRTGVDYNTGDYTNPAFDSLLDQAAVEADEATRFGLYQQAEQMLVDDAACVPLWFSTSYILIKPYVKNYEVDARGIPNLSQVYIQKK